MKNLISILLLTISSCVSAQENKYPVPDYNNTPYQYNGKDLIELDAEQFVMGARPKGLTGAESAIYVNGAFAKAKFAKENATFIVKLEVGVDPRTLMDMSKMTTNEHSGKRELVIYKKGMFTSEATNPTIDIAFKKIGEGLYLVTPKSPITAGEYMFSLASNVKSKVVYCFSVN